MFYGRRPLFLQHHLKFHVHFDAVGILIKRMPLTARTLASLDFLLNHNVEKDLGVFPGQNGRKDH